MRLDPVVSGRPRPPHRRRRGGAARRAVEGSSPRAARAAHRSDGRAAGGAVRRGEAGAARRAPGAGYLGQGRHDPEGLRAAGSPGRRRHRLQGAHAARAGARLSLAGASRRCRPGARSGSSTARTTRTCSWFGSMGSCPNPSGGRATSRSTCSSASSPRTASPSSSSSCTSPGRSSASASGRGWRSPGSTGSFRLETWASATGGTSTRRRTRRRCGAPARAAAPWYVVPADKKYLRDLLVAQVVAETLERMDPKYPGPPKNLRALKARLR